MAVRMLNWMLIRTNKSKWIIIKMYDQFIIIDNAINILLFQ